MNQYVIFAGLVLAALLVAFIILRIVVSVVSSIPKWIYGLIILAALFGAAIIAFGKTLFRAFF
jgi:hypothetical protein